MKQFSALLVALAMLAGCEQAQPDVSISQPHQAKPTPLVINGSSNAIATGAGSAAIAEGGAGNQVSASANDATVLVVSGSNNAIATGEGSTAISISHPAGGGGVHQAAIAAGKDSTAINVSGDINLPAR